MEFNHALTGFRGFAFLNVLIDHYTYIDNVILDIGQFGVGIFFVLSSYLLTLQLYKQYVEKNTMNLPNYFIRRFFRIYPCLIVALIAEYLTKRLTNKQIISIFNLTGVVGFYWAIYVEMRFYVILPLIVYIFANLSKFFRFCLMGILIILSCYFHYYLNFIVEYPRGFRRWDINDYSFEKNIIFINYLPIFGLGVFAAITVYHLKESKYEFVNYKFLKGISIFILSFIHLPMIYYRCVNNSVKTFWDLPFSNFGLIFCTGYCIIILFLNGNENFMTKFYESRVMKFIGEISYPAYLFHTIVREFTFEYLYWQPEFPHLFSCFIFTIIIAYLLHITVETFFIDLTKFWFNNKKLTGLNKENTNVKFENKDETEKLKIINNSNVVTDNNYNTLQSV